MTLYAAQPRLFTFPTQGPDPTAESELSQLLFQKTFLYFESPSQV